MKRTFVPFNTKRILLYTLYTGLTLLLLSGCGGGGKKRSAHNAPLPAYNAKTPRTNWTVLVYFVPDHSENTNPWINHIFLDIIRTCNNPNVNFAIQSKKLPLPYPSQLGEVTYQPGTHRHLVRHEAGKNSLSFIHKEQDLGNRYDMGSARNFKDFINWGTDSFPADRYALILWGHGYRTSALSDPHSGNSLSLQDIREGIGHHKIDVVYSHGCHMQNIEANLSLRGKADYYVASQPATFLDDEGYLEVFRALYAAPAMSGEDLARTFARECGGSGRNFLENRQRTRSAIDLNRLPHVIQALDRLGRGLLNQRRTDQAGTAQMIQRVAHGSQGFGGSDKDLYDIASKILIDPHPSPEVRQAAQQVQQAVQQAVIEQRITSDVPGAHGITVHFPPHRTGNDQIPGAPNWNQWLKSI